MKTKRALQCHNDEHLYSSNNDKGNKSSKEDIGRNSPLNRCDNDQCLQPVAAGVVAGAGLGDHGRKGNPAAEPEQHGNNFDEGNDEFMRDAREPEWGEAEVGDCDDGGPAAVEEQKVVQVGEGP